MALSAAMRARRLAKRRACVREGEDEQVAEGGQDDVAAARGKPLGKPPGPRSLAFARLGPSGRGIPPGSEIGEEADVVEQQEVRQPAEEAAARAIAKPMPKA